MTSATPPPAPHTLTNGVELAVAAVTDAGLKRRANEDSLLAEAPVYLVADGMGGYEAGDRASAAVVEAFRREVVAPAAGGGAEDLASIRAALVAAERDVAAIASQTTRGAGSTVTGVVLVEHEGRPHWLVFNIGDSRVYRHVGSDLEQVTVDHSLAQELVDRGELDRDGMRTFANRNAITRAIGAADSRPDSWVMPVVNGERLLVCSDGLTSEITDEAIRAALTMNGAPEAAAGSLVEAALRAGGGDNVSVIVLDVLRGGAPMSSDYTTGGWTGLDELTDSEADADTLPVR